MCDRTTQCLFFSFNPFLFVYKVIYSVLLVLELITKTKCLVSESVAADTSNTLASCEHEGKPTRAKKAVQEIASRSWSLCCLIILIMTDELSVTAKQQNGVL